MRHADRVVLVTGGSGGIGAAIVARYLAEGASVGIVDSNGDAGERQAADWRAKGERVHFAAADVADYASCERAQRQLEGALGPIDGLLHGVGSCRRLRMASEVRVEEFFRTLCF